MDAREEDGIRYVLAKSFILILQILSHPANPVIGAGFSGL
jgi:hypothetical protein